MLDRRRPRAQEPRAALGNGSKLSNANADAASALLALQAFVQRDRTGFEAAAAKLEAVRQEKDAAEERWLEIEIKRETLAG